MTDGDDDLVIAIEDDAAPPGGHGSDGDPADVLKAQFEELQKVSAADKARAEAAERRAADEARAAAAARKDATEARTVAADSQLGNVESGLAAAQAEASSAEGELAALMEKGDFAGAAKAQRRLANAEAKIVRLDEAKADLEAAKSAPARSEPEARRADTQADPVEQFISSKTEPTAKWLREHRDWVGDPKKSAMLSVAHYAAIEAGQAVDTPGYFEAVELNLGLRNAPGAKAQNGNGKAPLNGKRSAAPPAAPVNGGAGAGSSGGGNAGDNTVTLSKREAAAATDGTLVWNYDDTSPQKRFKKGDPIGQYEFARRKRELQRQGQYDKNAIDA